MSHPPGTASYWQNRYASGGNSGAGSYGHLALYKARFLNRFVQANQIGSVGELGCGDGAQLSRALYPHYIGYDVSQAAIEICKNKFADDKTKKFFCLTDILTLSDVELALSLDVVYHLLEDATFDEYMRQLFRMSARYVIIYGNGIVKPYDASHVNLRDFQSFIVRNLPSWHLGFSERNPFYSEVGTDPNTSWSNFYVYERAKSYFHFLSASITPGYEQTGLATAEPLRLTLENYLQTSIEKWRDLSHATSGIQVVEVEQAQLETPLAADRQQRFSEFNHAMCTSLPVTEGYLKEFSNGPWFYDSKPGTWKAAVNPNPQVIVSLTTIKSRLQNIEKVLHSIFQQSRVPDRVCLYISNDAHLQDEGITVGDLPVSLVRSSEAGILEISFVKNTGPYRKLLPALERYWQSNAVIVTADDDTLYPVFWLDELYTAYLQHRCIVAARCNRMKFAGGVPLPYLKWSSPESGDRPKAGNERLFIFPTGKDGVLYHPSFFTEDIFDPELVRLSPTSDDLTFKLLSLLTKTKVFQVPKRLSTLGLYSEFPTVTTPGGTSLWKENSAGLNDVHLQALLTYLKEKQVLDITEFF